MTDVTRRRLLSAAGCTAGATVTAGLGAISVASRTNADLGTIATGGGQASTSVTFNWPSTAARASFTVNVTADGGYSGSSTVTVLR